MPKRINRKNLKAVIENLPDNRYNPQNAEGCLYTNRSGQHCFAGQILVDLGYEKFVPKWGDDCNESVSVSQIIDDPYFLTVIPADEVCEIVNLLTEIQAFADGFNEDDLWRMKSRPRRWSTVKRFALNRLENM